MNGSRFSLWFTRLRTWNIPKYDGSTSILSPIYPHEQKGYLRLSGAGYTETGMSGSKWEGREIILPLRMIIILLFGDFIPWKSLKGKACR
jgi:hypothetical protein